MYTAMSSSAQTVITLLSELDQAIAIHAQDGKDDASSESSAQDLLCLQEDISEQARTHGTECIDRAKLTQVGPRLILPSWVPKALEMRWVPQLQRFL